MFKLTESLKQFLVKKHPEIIGLVMLGHTELLTDEITAEYMEWCKTDEGKSYLEGGENYKEPS